MANKRDILTEFKISGEQQYSAAMKDCRDKVALLDSEMAKLQSAYSGQMNTMEALQQKGQILAQKYDAQKQKVDGLRSAVENAKSAQQGWQQRAETNAKKAEVLSQRLQKLKDSTEDTSEEQKNLQKELDDVNKDLEKAQRRYESTTQTVNKYQKALNYAEADLNKTSAAIKDNNKHLDEAENSADGCASSIDGFGKKAADSGEKSTLFGQLTSKAVGAAAGAFTATGIINLVVKLAKAYNEAVEEAAKYETALAKVATIADTSAMPMEKASRAILDVSSSMGVSAEDLSESVYQAISASVDSADAVNFAAQAVKLAKGGFTDAATAVDTLTTILNAYSKKTSETEHVMDVLITTQNLGKTSVDALGKSMAQTIPFAASYNVSLEDLSASYAILTKNGTKAAEASTKIKAMLTELGDTGSIVGKTLKEETGESFLQLMSSGKSLYDILDVLQQSVGGSTEAFNQLWSSVEAQAAALTLAKGGASEYDDTLSAMKKSAGAAESAYNTMADTAEEASGRAKSAFDNLKKSMVSTEFKTEWENYWAGLWESSRKNKERGDDANDLLEEQSAALKKLKSEWKSGSITNEEYENKRSALQKKYNNLLEECRKGIYREKQARRDLFEENRKSLGEMREMLETYDNTEESVERLIEYMALESAGSSMAAQMFGEERDAIVSVRDEMDALSQAYEVAKNSAYDSLSSTVGTFEMFDATAATSIDAATAALNSQMDWMSNYGANLDTVMQMAADAGIALTDSMIEAMTSGTQEGAALVQGLVNSGADGIAQLNDSWAGLEEGKETLSGTLAGYVTDYDRKMSELEKRENEAVNNLNQSVAAYNATQDTFNAAVRAAGTYTQFLETAYANAGAAAASAYNSALSNGLANSTPSGSFRNVQKSRIPMDAAANKTISRTVAAFNAGGRSDRQTITVQADNGALLSELRALRREIADTGIFLDTGALVGGLANGMDSALGKKMTMARRGDM
mgnify:FL=1|nr:MAG TPA: minor tail protein [Caudoviricetes sp.]